MVQSAGNVKFSNEILKPLFLIKTDKNVLQPSDRMPLKLKLKQSQQSLAARGLPQKKKIQVVADLVETSIESDKVGSVYNGLDRCASLLAAMIDSPKANQKNNGGVIVAKDKKKAPTQNPVITKKTTGKTQYNKRLVSSTPAQSNKIKMSDSIASYDTVDELIGERERLQQYLEAIVADKLKIQQSYKNIAETQNENGESSRSSLHSSLTDSTNKHVLSKSLKARDSVAKPQSIFTNSYSMNHYNTVVCNTSANQVPAEPSRIGTIFSPGSRLSTHKKEEAHEQLEDLMKSITKKLLLEKDKQKDADSFSKSHTYTDNNDVHTLEDSVVNSCTTPENSRLHNSLNLSNRKRCNYCLGDNTERTHTDKNCSPCKEKSTNIFPENCIPVTECINRSAQTDSPASQRKLCRNKNEAGRSLYDSPITIQVHLTTLKYMMQELQTVLEDNGDLELHRLLNEIDHIIGLLPFAIENTAVDVQSKINVALQPVRVENADLRRKLHLIEQNVKTATVSNAISQRRYQEGVWKENEALAVIKKLEAKVSNDEKTMSKLVNEIADVCQVTEDLKIENQKLLQALSGKEVKQFEERSAWLNERSATSAELNHLQSLQQKNELTIRANEKEINILKLTGKQKDAEIERLGILNSDLQQSVSKLLSDIHIERQRLGLNKKLKKPRGIPTNDQFLQQKSTQLSKPNYKTERQEHTPVPQSHIMSHNNDNHGNNFLKSCVATTSTSVFMNDSYSTMLNDVEGESLSTLGTYDNLDFQRDLSHLEGELSVIQKALINSHASVLIDKRSTEKTAI